MQRPGASLEFPGMCYISSTPLVCAGQMTCTSWAVLSLRSPALPC